MSEKDSTLERPRLAQAAAPRDSMKGRANLTLLLLLVPLPALFLFVRCTPRAVAPEALDLDRAGSPTITPLAPLAQLEAPPESSTRTTGEEAKPLFPFDLASAQRIRLESSKEFELTEVWLKTALEPRWVERPLLDGMELPYLKSELPLDIRAPGHRDYPVKRASDFALLLVDAYTLLDFSGLGSCSPVRPGLIFPRAHANPRGRDLTEAPEFLHRWVENELHVALSRNHRALNPRARLEHSFNVATSCGWRLSFDWKPLPESKSELDVAARVPMPQATVTSVRVRLSAPFEFDPDEIKLIYSKSDRSYDRFHKSPPREFDVHRNRIPEWGEIRLIRDMSPRELTQERTGSRAEWTLTNLPVGGNGTLVASHSKGEAFGRWFGKLEPDQEIEIRLEPGVFLTGTLQDRVTGEPISGGEISLAYSEPRGIRSHMSSDPNAWASLIEVDTDPSGKFRVPTTANPPGKYEAPSRPSYELWATFRAPFYEPEVLHLNESSREIDAGRVTLTPIEPDLVLTGKIGGKVAANSTLLIKRKGIQNPKLCVITAKRYVNGRLELRVQGRANPSDLHQFGADEPSVPIERGLLSSAGATLPFVREGSEREFEAIRTRKIEIEVRFPKSTDPRFVADLSYDWKGLRVSVMQFKIADTREPVLRSQTIPDEEIELFITSKDGKLEKRILVPRDQQRVVFRW